MWTRCSCDCSWSEQWRLRDKCGNHRKDGTFGEMQNRGCREQIEKFSRLDESRTPGIQELFLCCLQIMSALNCTGPGPWACAGVARGMETSTSVSEGTVVQLKHSLTTDGKMTFAFCWGINSNVGVVKWQQSRNPHSFTFQPLKKWLKWVSGLIFRDGAVRHLGNSKSRMSLHWKELIRVVLSFWKPSSQTIFYKPDKSIQPGH